MRRNLINSKGSTGVLITFRGNAKPYTKVSKNSGFGRRPAISCCCRAVRDEQTYNRMNEAMFKFKKSLFNPIHKSYYNDVDITILDETVAEKKFRWISAVERKIRLFFP